MHRFISFSALVLLATTLGLAQWKQVKVPDASITYSFAVSGNTFFAGTAGGIFRSQDTGKSWVKVPGLTTVSSCESLAASGNDVFAAMAGGSVYRSHDKGDTWEEVNVGLNFGALPIIAASGSGLFVGSWEFTLYRSLDGGGSWTTIHGGPSDMDIQSFATGDSILFVGTSANAGMAGGIYRSRDNGESWTKVNYDLGVTRTQALAMSEGVLYAGKTGVNGGVFRSRDNGDTWTKHDKGMTRKEIYSVLADGSDLFAGTEYGDVYHSRDEGETWTPIQDGLMKATVYALAVFDSTLFVGVGDAIWKRPVAEIVAADVRRIGRPKTPGFAPGIPYRVGDRAYFRLPDRAAVRLGLSDAAGRETELLRGTLGKGEHSVQLPRRTPEGARFLFLSVDGTTRAGRKAVR